MVSSESEHPLISMAASVVRVSGLGNLSVRAKEVAWVNWCDIRDLVSCER